jgi:hypothetical protein
MNYLKKIWLVAVWLISCLLVSAQDQRLIAQDQEFVNSSSLRIMPPLDVESIRIEFSQPNRSSKEGVCDSFPLARTAEPDELLKVEAKLILDLNRPAAVGEYQIEMTLKLDVAQVIGMDVTQYHRRLKSFKEAKRELLLAALKQELNDQRFLFQQMTDEDLLKQHSSPELEQKIEQRYMNLREKVVWSSEFLLRETWASNDKQTQQIEIPFDRIVYPQNLEPWRVYKVSFSQNIPHCSDQIGMFYTVKVLNGN